MTPDSCRIAYANRMDHIAFFWVGQDTNIPACLVQSARLIYGDDVAIHQLTDVSTPDIAGVNQVIRSRLSPEIMVARLQAYASLPPQEGMVFYCDADSLITTRLDLHALDPTKTHITERDNGAALINPHFPEHYPEFEGKTLGAVMPFLFGAMALCDGGPFFQRLLEICLQLPARFHRWYGDQVALHAAYQILPQENFARLPLREYLHIEREEIPVPRFQQLMQNHVKMVTFKGPSSKVFLPQSLSNLQRAL